MGVMSSLLFVCLSFCLSVSEHDSRKSNQMISLKRGVMTGPTPTSQKNCLTFGDDPVPDTDRSICICFYTASSEQQLQDGNKNNNNNKKLQFIFITTSVGLTLPATSITTATNLIQCSWMDGWMACGNRTEVGVALISTRHVSSK